MDSTKSTCHSDIKSFKRFSHGVVQHCQAERENAIDAQLVCFLRVWTPREMAHRIANPRELL